MITILEREIEVVGSGSGSSSTENGNGNANGEGRASGVEEHVTNAHHRPGHASTSTGSAQEKPKKREYTVQQLEVVKRVKGCKHYQYYEILSGKWEVSKKVWLKGLVEKTCTDGDVKKAYKKVCTACGEETGLKGRSWHWRYIQIRSTSTP